MSKGERRRAHFKSLFAARWPPGRGDFPLGDFSHAPSPKNRSKNGLPQKGGNLSAEGDRLVVYLNPSEQWLEGLPFNSV
jgi:hypothetical protein